MLRKKQATITEEAAPRTPADERVFAAPAEAAGQRLDHFLVQQLGSISRSRIQLLLEQGGVAVDGKPAKASLRLRGGEAVTVRGEAEPPPLRAIPEAIPLDIIYEDDDLAVVNKPAGMMVHAGAGATEDVRNRGTLVNALLHHFAELSSTGGELRPGIVHRLDKETSGLILVAKNDWTHQKLAEMFSARQVRKSYIALVHGEMKRDSGTVNEPIGRDSIRRTRMTTKRMVGARTAVSHYEVLKRFAGRYGRFTLAAVRIETGRTHQIRVHLASIGHPVVGDTLYGAPTRIVAHAATAGKRRAPETEDSLHLQRNFLHAAELEFTHPRSGSQLKLRSPLPAELTGFLRTLDAAAGAAATAQKA